MKFKNSLQQEVAFRLSTYLNSTTLSSKLNDIFFHFKSIRAPTLARNDLKKNGTSHSLMYITTKLVRTVIFLTLTKISFELPFEYLLELSAGCRTMLIKGSQITKCITYTQFTFTY